MEMVKTQTALTLPNRDNEEKLRVRAVHATMMRWIVEGVPVDEILREHPMSLQEFTAQRRVRDVFEAIPGTMASIKAVDRLLQLIDGSDEDHQPKSPVTLIAKNVGIFPEDMK